MSRKLILIKHASPKVEEGLPPKQWPLSDEVKAKCEALARDVAAYSPGVVVTSDEMKAEDTVTIDLSGKSTLADFMVVTCGRSNRHVGAVADRVLDDLARAGVRNTRVEGMPHCDWVLIDAGDVIVHVFRPEVRAFYNLEKMWMPARASGRRAS